MDACKPNTGGISNRVLRFKPWLCRTEIRALLEIWNIDLDSLWGGRSRDSKSKFWKIDVDFFILTFITLRKVSKLEGEQRRQKSKRYRHIGNRCCCNGSKKRKKLATKEWKPSSRTFIRCPQKSNSFCSRITFVNANENTLSLFSSGAGSSAKKEDRISRRCSYLRSKLKNWLTKITLSWKTSTKS